MFPSLCRILKKFEVRSFSKCGIEIAISILGQNKHSRTSSELFSNQEVVMGSNSLALSRIGREKQQNTDEVRAIKHEVLNALTPVVAYAKDLAKGEKDARKREQLLAIERAGLAIERLVRALGRGRELFEPDFKVVPVSKLLKEASQEALALAQQRGVTLRVLDDYSGSRQVIADPGLIRRLLVNLMFNAVEASEEGSSVILDARHVPEGIRLSVSDQGPGFEAEDLDALPDGFSSKGEGHGTGLSVCKTIAMLHGSILRSRNLNPGAEVFFVLAQFSSRPDRRVDSQKPRLLVVDNDPNVANSVSNLLSKRYTVDVAYDKSSALDILQWKEVDAMALDMDLGRTSGQDLLGEMENLGLQRPRRLVFVTGDPAARDGDLIQGVAVLTKPFDSQSLLQMLEHRPQRSSWFVDLCVERGFTPCAACA